MLAHDRAMENGGDFLLRIEDIDRSRAKPEWEKQIYEDLKWLGIWWPQPVLRQYEHLDQYKAVLKSLWGGDLIYPCTCTRRDIQNALSAPQEGSEMPIGPDGPVYPGTCRQFSGVIAPDPMPDSVMRLNMRAAIAEIVNAPYSEPITFVESGGGQKETIEVSPEEAIEHIGDIVLARKDMGTSYHLSVIFDDMAQGVTEVVRGADLFEATKIHVILQRLLQIPTPTYHHHKLIRDDTGKRLAKRDDARAISKYRADGTSPADIREMVGL